MSEAEFPAKDQWPHSPRGLVAYYSPGGYLKDSDLLVANIYRLDPDEREQWFALNAVYHRRDRIISYLNQGIDKTRFTAKTARPYVPMLDRLQGIAVTVRDLLAEEMMHDSYVVVSVVHSKKGTPIEVNLAVCWFPAEEETQCNECGDTAREDLSNILVNLAAAKLQERVKELPWWKPPAKVEVQPVNEDTTAQCTLTLGVVPIPPR